MKQFGYPKQLRLLKSHQFQHVFAQQVFAADDTLVINAGANELEHMRLGLSIGRRVGNAVVRNRWKRLIREAFRMQRLDFSCGIDIVVRPRKDAVCDSSAVHRSLGKLIRRTQKKINNAATNK